jgi:integrase
MYSGLRRSEIFKLEDRDIDYWQNIIELRDPKGGRLATVPMSGTSTTPLFSKPKTTTRRLPWWIS